MFPLAQVHTVEVVARVAEPDLFVTYHLIVKSQPQNEDARTYLQPSHTFEKEVKFWKLLFNAVCESMLFRTQVQMYGQVFHDMANFVRRESIVDLNCKDSEVCVKLEPMNA